MILYFLWLYGSGFSDGQDINSYYTFQLLSKSECSENYQISP